MASINFFSEQIPFTIPHPRKSANWIRACIKQEKKKLELLNFIFCSDEYLRTINIQYLGHHTFTDIVTFDQSDKTGYIEGDIYISIDRIKENALSFNTNFDNELHRVIIHGVLHLAGYSDKSKPQKKVMREKEDAYLSLRNS
jgi:rRNA maturation RNase YbeY